MFQFYIVVLCLSTTEHSKKFVGLLIVCYYQEYLTLLMKPYDVVMCPIKINLPDVPIVISVFPSSAGTKSE